MSDEIEPTDEQKSARSAIAYDLLAQLLLHQSTMIGSGLSPRIAIGAVAWAAFVRLAEMAGEEAKADGDEPDINRFVGMAKEAFNQVHGQDKAVWVVGQVGVQNETTQKAERLVDDFDETAFDGD